MSPRDTEISYKYHAGLAEAAFASSALLQVPTDCFQFTLIVYILTLPSLYNLGNFGHLLCMFINVDSQKQHMKSSQLG